MGGGHSAAFLFDPTDKRDYAPELKAARSASIAHANRQYRHSLSVSHSVSHSMSGAVMGTAHRGPRGDPEAAGRHSIAVTFPGPGPARASTQAMPAGLDEPAASTGESPSI